MERILHSQKSKTKKAQIQITDLILSLFIFLILLGFMYIVIYNRIYFAQEQIDKTHADIVLDNLLLSILYNPGVPTDWAAKQLNPSDLRLKAIGCAQAPNEIDEFKLQRLSEIYDDNYTKQKLGLGRFDADINISYLNGTTAQYIGNLQANKQIIGLKKTYCVYNNTIAKIVIRLWEK